MWPTEGERQSYSIRSDQISYYLQDFCHRMHQPACLVPVSDARDGSWSRGGKATRWMDTIWHHHKSPKKIWEFMGLDDWALDWWNPPTWWWLVAWWLRSFGAGWRSLLGGGNVRPLATAGATCPWGHYLRARLTAGWNRITKCLLLSCL